MAMRAANEFEQLGCVPAEGPSCLETPEEGALASVQPALLSTIIVAAVSGFAGGLFAWVAGVFFGKPLARFYELRADAYRLIFIGANIGRYRFDAARTAAIYVDLRRTAAEIDVLGAVLPKSARWFLAWRGYNLVQATAGLLELSDSSHKSDGLKAFHRVNAQQGLRLPIDPGDRAVFERRSRLEDI